MLLREVERYRGDGIATRLFYENKVAQAFSLLIAREKALGNPAGRRLNGQDRVQLENVTPIRTSIARMRHPWTS